MRVDYDEQGNPSRMVFSPGESLLPALSVLKDPEFKAFFADYSKTMTKSDLTDKFVLPVYAARTLDDFLTLTPLTTFAPKQVEIGWERGDPLKASLVTSLTGTGVQDGTAIEGAEEEFTVTQKSFSISEYTNAVAWTRLAAKTSKYSLEEVARQSLRDWALRKIETLLWETLEADTNISTIRPNDRTSKYQLQSGDTLDTATIKKAVWTMRVNRVPGFTAKDVDGRKVYSPAPLGFYVMVVPGELLYDLSSDTDFKNAKTHAADLARSLSPWEANVYLYEGALLVQGDPRVFDLEDLGYSYRIGRGIIFGADAYLLGFGKPNEGEILEFSRQEDDYKRKVGLAVSIYFGGGAVWTKNAMIIEASATVL